MFSQDYAIIILEHCFSKSLLLTDQVWWFETIYRVSLHEILRRLTYTSNFDLKLLYLKVPFGICLPCNEYVINASNAV